MVQELLFKGAIVETIPSQVSFVSQIFLDKKKKGGRTMTSDQSKGPEIISLIGTFQNGRFTFYSGVMIIQEWHIDRCHMVSQ